MSLFFFLWNKFVSKPQAFISRHLILLQEKRSINQYNQIINPLFNVMLALNKKDLFFFCFYIIVLFLFMLLIYVNDEESIQKINNTNMCIKMIDYGLMIGYNFFLFPHLFFFSLFWYHLIHQIKYILLVAGSFHYFLHVIWRDWWFYITWCMP